MYCNRLSLSTLLTFPLLVSLLSLSRSVLFSWMSKGSGCTKDKQINRHSYQLIYNNFRVIYHVSYNVYIQSLKDMICNMSKNDQTFAFIFS